MKIYSKKTQEGTVRTCKSGGGGKWFILFAMLIFRNAHLSKHCSWSHILCWNDLEIPYFASEKGRWSICLPVCQSHSSDGPVGKRVKGWQTHLELYQIHWKFKIQLQNLFAGSVVGWLMRMTLCSQLQKTNYLPWQETAVCVTPKHQRGNFSEP